MPLTGEAKVRYQREYMRRQRAKQKPARKPAAKPPADLDRVLAEYAAALKAFRATGKGTLRFEAARAALHVALGVGTEREIAKTQAEPVEPKAKSVKFEYEYIVSNSATGSRKDKQLQNICGRHGCKIDIRENRNAGLNQREHVAKITAPNTEIADRSQG